MKQQEGVGQRVVPSEFSARYEDKPTSGEKRGSGSRSYPEAQSFVSTVEPVTCAEKADASPFVGPKVAVLILGMHRSGTSVLTRVCAFLGADLPTKLMPKNSANEEGFWESQEIVDLNEAVLRSAGSSWDDWRRFNPDWFASPLCAAFKARALELLQRDFSASPLFLLKDPRICRVLPFWLEVIHEYGAEIRCVLPIRNPLEVAASLGRRDGISPAKSFMLWLRHVLDTEYESRGLKRAFIAYGALLDDWRGTMSDVSARTDIAWPRRSATSEVEIDAFLQQRLRHHVIGEEKLAEHPEVAEWVKDTYAAISALREMPYSSDALARLDGIRDEFDRASDALGTLLRAEELVREDLSRSLEARDEQIAAINATLGEWETHNAELRAKSMPHDAEMTRARDSVSRLKTCLHAASREAANARHVQDELLRRIADMEQSRSWRMTRPYRAMGSAMKGGAHALARTGLSARFVVGTLLVPAALAYYGGLLNAVRASRSRSGFFARIVQDQDVVRERLLQRGRIYRRLAFLGFSMAVRVLQAGGVTRSVGNFIHVLRQEGISGIHERLVATAPGLEGQSTVVRPTEPADPLVQLLAEARRVPPGAAVAEATKYSPLISILLPTYNTPMRYLEEVLQSIMGQSYDNWEVCAVDDGSANAEVRRTLEEAAAADPRFKVAALAENLGIASASHHALGMATGEYVAVVDHDDILAPSALSRIVSMLREDPGADLIYSDHAMMTEDGDLISAALKPDWAPETLLSTNYIVHFKVMRRSLVQQVGGFGGTLDLSQDTGLLLRLLELEPRVRHCPEILYFWRTHPHSVASGTGAKPRIGFAGCATIDAYLERQGLPARGVWPAICRERQLGGYKLEFTPDVTARTAIIVPFRSSAPVAKRLKELAASAGGVEPPLLHLVALGGDAPDIAGCQGHVAPDQAAFDAILAGIDCDNFVFLSPTARLIVVGWLPEIIGYLRISPLIGAVGGKVLDEGLNIRDGARLLLPGLPVIGWGESDAADGYWLNLRLASNVEAVSSGLMATPKAVVVTVGGPPVFTYGENAGIAYCLRLRDAGYRVVFNPWSKIVDDGDPPQPDAPARLAAERGGALPRDRYYHPLFATNASYVLA